jgi:hypothetical protein
MENFPLLKRKAKSEMDSEASLQTLPWRVRYRIYELIGIVHSNHFDLTTRRSALGKVGCDLSYNAESQHGTSQCSVELMRVCRSIHDDLNSVLYSSNAFALCQHEVGDESNFLALSPGSLSLMTDLLIHFGRLSESSRLEEGFGELENIINHLAKATNLSSLSLTIYGINIPEKVLNTLFTVFSTLSGLKECCVRLFPLISDLNAPQYEGYSATARSIATSVTGSPNIMGFQFERLPVELQRHILSFAGLVIPFRKIGKPQGLEIIAGKPSYQQDDSTGCCGNCTTERKWSICGCVYNGNGFSTSCTCYRFPVALFSVSRHISQLTREVVLSENRIILKEDISGALAWLRKTPHELLNQIRALDFVFTSTQLRQWGHLSSTESAVEVPPEWALIAQTLEERLALKNITLSFDAANMYGDLFEDELIHRDQGKEYFESLKYVYRALIKPFASYPRFREMRNFFVYWPLFASSEDESEKAVMGPEYDAQARAKIPYRDRDWRLPHGWEWVEEDADGKLNQDWLDYDAEYMQDIE